MTAVAVTTMNENSRQAAQCSFSNLRLFSKERGVRSASAGSMAAMSHKASYVELRVAAGRARGLGIMLVLSESIKSETEPFVGSRFQSLRDEAKPVDLRNDLLSSSYSEVATPQDSISGSVVIRNLARPKP